MHNLHRPAAARRQTVDCGVSEKKKQQVQIASLEVAV